MVATSVVLAATACSDHDDYNPCPLTTLVVRDTQPGSTFGNEYRCIGDVESSPCFMPTRARVDDYPACEGETVLAIGGSPPGRGLSLYLDISDGDVRSARAQFERFTDDPPPPPPEPAIWGWFLPSEISDDRIAGAFSLQFGDGVVEGLVYAPGLFLLCADLILDVANQRIRAIGVVLAADLRAAAPTARPDQQREGERPHHEG